MREYLWEIIVSIQAIVIILESMLLFRRRKLISKSAPPLLDVLEV